MKFSEALALGSVIIFAVSGLGVFVFGMLSLQSGPESYDYMDWMDWLVRSWAVSALLWITMCIATR